MEIKYFRSKYAHSKPGMWIETIQELGVNVYDVIVPSELAVILGGFMENPSAFRDTLTLVFYRRDDYYEDADNFIPVLEKYFDELVDLTGLNSKESADKIRSTVETYQ